MAARNGTIQVPSRRGRIFSDSALFTTGQKKLKVFTRDENQEPNSRIPLRKRKTRSTRAPLFDIDQNIEKNEKYDEEDEVFVDGAQQKQDNVVLLYGHAQISPIRPNVYSSRKTIICQGIPPQLRQPAKKLTLLQKVSKKPFTICNHLFLENTSNGNLDIFNMEYLEDIILYQLQNDWKYVVPENYGFHITQDYDKNEVRASVVNWIVQAHDYLNLATPTLLMIIRLFDSMFDSILIPCNMCQLVILVLLWIVHKYQDNVTVLKIPKLLGLCTGVYSKNQFLKMEKKVLKFFSFDLNVPDASIYVSYYIKKLNMESELLIQCVHCILECFALNVEFARGIPSVHAAAATTLALQILHPNIKAWKNLEGSIGYYAEEELFPTITDMLQQLRKVQDRGYKYRQPYIKYSVKERFQASTVLLDKLIAS